MSAPSPRRLLRAIEIGTGTSLSLLEAQETPWASATFGGQTWRLVVAIAGPEAAARTDTFERTLGDAEFNVPGHIVADALVVERESRAEGFTLTIEILTVADA